MTTTNQALIDALRERAAKRAPDAHAPDLLRLAQVAALCTLAEGRASDEDREELVSLLPRNTGAPTK